MVPDALAGVWACLLLGNVVLLSGLLLGTPLLGLLILGLSNRILLLRLLLILCGVIRMQRRRRWPRLGCLALALGLGLVHESHLVDLLLAHAAQHRQRVAEVGLCLLLDLVILVLPRLLELILGVLSHLGLGRLGATRGLVVLACREQLSGILQGRGRRYLVRLRGKDNRGLGLNVGLLLGLLRREHGLRQGLAPSTRNSRRRSSSRRERGTLGKFRDCGSALLLALLPLFRLDPLLCPPLRRLPGQALGLDGQALGLLSRHAGAALGLEAGLLLSLSRSLPRSSLHPLLRPSFLLLTLPRRCGLDIGSGLGFGFGLGSGNCGLGLGLNLGLGFRSLLCISLCLCLCLLSSFRGSLLVRLFLRLFLLLGPAFRPLRRLGPCTDELPLGCGSARQNRHGLL
mmetsp:Transcript_58436/g.189246  ORF Transcript_58436/g.189246 Transcript_58436/m.189246 type:complete len:400 (-) Transcript_58436:68-1267(-)